MKFILPLSFLALIGVSASAQQKQNLKPADFYKIPTLGDAKVSPDGKWIAYNLSEVDTAKNNRVSHLWMQSWDGRESVQLTYGAEAASSAQWSPDGKYISFISSRESKNGSQLWLMDRRGGEGRKLTDVKGDINDYAWSPDAKKILLVMEDPENKGKEAPKTPEPIDIDRYHFKQDVTGYLQHLHSHLYLFDLERKKLDTLTTGNYDESDISWSPDGSRIAFVSNRTPDPDRNSNSDIYWIEAKPGAAMHQLTTWTGHDNNPQWSPDGKHIAYLRSTGNTAYNMYDQDILCLMDADGQHNVLLTKQLDRPVGNPTWSKDSQHLAFLVSDDRTEYLAEYNIAAKKISTINKGQYAITSFEAVPGGNWMLKMSNPYLPAELFASDNGTMRRLTFHQKEWLKTVKLPHVEGFSSKSKDGTTVNGLVYTPDSSRRKLPFILYIHGGPVGQDTYSFDATRMTLAAAGYAVAGVNYRGSSGRGLAYCKAISGDWGNKEVADLLGAVNQLVKEGIADPDHLGIGGWSYGGILTDYTIASDTRFKAAASGAGSALQLSMYGLDQYVLQYENELGVPWKNAAKYIKLSYPFFHSDRIKTPVLFMAGQRDFNVPSAGSEQMYQALKSQGLPVELVIYPNSYHGITTPSYQVDRLQRYVDWYNKWLKK